MENQKVLKKSHLFSSSNLEKVFSNLPDPIFVTDKHGNILLSNSTTAHVLDLSLDQLMKSNVKDLVQKGYYSKTHTTEVVEKKCVVSGVLKTKLDFSFISTSTPVFNDTGEVEFVITTARPQELIEQYTCKDQLDQTNQYKREMEYLRNYVLNSDEIIAESKIMREALLLAHTLAQTDSTVLLLGETGTGKELFAKYIHNHGKRARNAFIAVNCATFPENLVESELFGYEKGAFTGANQKGKIGLIQAADKGTLFLDEIAELSLTLQSKLLRVLETGEVRRIGSNLDHKIDFKLIAATHKDLKKMVEDGLFRSDLYFRLNVIPIKIPPLRERPEDIIAIALKFLQVFNQKYVVNAELTSENIQALLSYNWPGNVRELRNEIERLVILSLQQYSVNKAILVDRVPGKITNHQLFNLLGLTGTLKDVLRKVEVDYIKTILQSCNMNVSKAAGILGITREALHRKIKSMSNNESKEV